MMACEMAFIGLQTGGCGQQDCGMLGEIVSIKPPLDNEALFASLIPAFRKY